MFAAEPCAPRAWQRRDPSATALSAYVRCGVLACGFARARCPSCGFDRLVAFSCKQRGLCPSCDGRRMTETAAELVERVLPDVPVRQWVLSLPWVLRVPVARDPALLTRVSRIFIDAIRRCLRAKVGPPGGRGRVEIGAVTVVQRFGGSLNMNPHFHVIVFDGVYLCPDDGTSPRFVATAPPTPDDRAAVLAEVAARVGRIRTASPDDGLDMWRAGAGAAGRFARVREEGTGDEEAAPAGSRRGTATAHEGFNLHTGVRVAGEDRDAVERLCRYVLRPAICASRITVLDEGRVAYRMKHPRHGGETHRVMTRREFMARVAALIPPPRYPLVRYHGVVAPNSPWRAMVVPGPRRSHHRDGVKAPGVSGAAMVAAGASVRGTLPRWDWATLLRRVWGVDALACARCGERMRWIAVIRDRAVIVRASAAHGPARRGPVSLRILGRSVNSMGGRRVVSRSAPRWSAYPPNPEIYRMDLRDRVSHRVTHDPADRPAIQGFPMIDGEWIVWSDKRHDAQPNSVVETTRSALYGWHLGTSREYVIDDASDGLWLAGPFVHEGWIDDACAIPSRRQRDSYYRQRLPLPQGERMKSHASSAGSAAGLPPEGGA